MSALDGLSIEDIDKAIKNATSFQSMTVDGETVTNPNVLSLMKLRQELKREEELRNGARSIFATFDMSNQNF